MSKTLDDGCGIPVPFRPLYVELSKQQIAAVQVAQAEADEEAFATRAVERARREGKTGFVDGLLRVLRLFKDVPHEKPSRNDLWLRVLERDEERHENAR